MSIPTYYEFGVGGKTVKDHIRHTSAIGTSFDSVGWENAKSQQYTWPVLLKYPSSDTKSEIVVGAGSKVSAIHESAESMPPIDKMLNSLPSKHRELYLIAAGALLGGVVYTILR